MPSSFFFHLDGKQSETNFFGLFRRTTTCNRYVTNRNILFHVLRARYSGIFVAVPSSSIIPKKFKNENPTSQNQLPFVNAGMVRWRPIFLNKIPLPERFAGGVANSQKCIRIGGKNCDLEEVGYDGHHHTFFEMLGSWAFNGAYGRDKSCQMAWQMLTKIYEIPQNKLFVTYFGGCDQFGLPPDHETKETWLQLGILTDAEKLTL